MWRWLARKLLVHLVSEVQDLRTATDIMRKHVVGVPKSVEVIQGLQDRLDSEHRDNMVAFYNLQEEVFLLRDELAAFANLVGVELINDFESGVRCEFTEGKDAELAKVVAAVEDRQGELYIERTAKALVTALAAVEERKKKARS